MTVRGCFGLLLAAFVIAFGATRARAGQQSASDAHDESLRESLQAMAKAHPGSVSLYAKDLKSGRSVELDSARVVQTASVIKLAILFEAMERVREGSARWNELLTLKPGDAVSGSGVLLFFDTPLTLTLKDVLTMMVVLSDNTATNLAIDRLGLDAINRRIASLGLRETYLYKKIGKPAEGPMPADQPRFGLGKTTAHEMEELMERIGLCQLDPLQAATVPLLPKDAAICDVGLTMLRNQFYRETIPRYLETLDASEGAPATASKTGSLDAVRNDVAIVAGKNGPILLSIFTYNNRDHGWTVDNEAEVLIARLARQIVTAWSPAGLNGKELVPGLGLRAVPPAGVSKESPGASNTPGR